ncbi:N-acetylglucosamine-6-phosphate deacetylase [Clostridium malenominatum]|uniref:N-acetylglucosamine-6-phosphate deacetylase n=1 Tax=Clostridium malenominatum TaxID=1539 RepID=A0ABP3TYK1_9CLOT
MRVIVNGKIITKDCVLKGKGLLFDEKIREIIDANEFRDIAEKNVNEKIEIIDAKENYISPGFIDLHIHGSGGSDTMDGSIEDLKVISKVISKNGVTGFLPTTMTMSREKIYRALDIIKEGMNMELGGAKIFGTHLEGPFINEKFKGAQKEEYIISPDIDFVKGYEDVIKIITLAPEKDNNFNFISKVKEETNIVLSIGHSNATYEEAMKAVDMGISYGTHTFNAMTPLNHRKPGVVGAIFSSKISCELIADKIHVHPGIFQMFVDIKGKEKVILITDSMRAGCMKDGISELGEQKVIVKDNSARLEDGTLAGSILTLNKAVRNVLENTKLQLHEVIAMATLNPARVIHMDSKKGSIEVGKDADIIIFDDELNIKHTIIEGKTIFQL